MAKYGPKRKQTKHIQHLPLWEGSVGGFGTHPQPHTDEFVGDYADMFVVFPPVLRVGPSGRPDGSRTQGTGDPMWRSDQGVIQPTVFYPYRLTFLKDTSSHMIKSRGNPCTPIIMWARQGTNHTDLLCGYTSK